MVPDNVGTWLDAPRPRGIGPWHEYSAIRSDFAAEMGVDVRARVVGHDFLYRLRPAARQSNLRQADYYGDWLAAEKAIHGVETRDPTADADVLSYCFGVPPGSIDVDRLKRAMKNWPTEGRGHAPGHRRISLCACTRGGSQSVLDLCGIGQPQNE
jgi:hypothetical protein